MASECDVNFDHLILSVAGELDEKEAGPLRVHLQSGCPNCERNLDWLRKVSKMLQAGGSPRPLSAMIRHIVSLFSEGDRDPDKDMPLLARMLVTRIPASLVFDSYEAKTLAGIRCGATWTRHLQFNADDLDIDIDIRRAEGPKFTLLGQVLPAGGGLIDIAGAEVYLLHGCQKLLTHAIDALGEFAFGHLDPGQYGLRLRVRDRQIEIAELGL